MSLATSRDISRTVCQNKDCAKRGDRRDFIEKRFCSNRCKNVAKGRGVLSDLRHDHTICFSCGNRLKTLSGTPPEWFWSGYQKITAECFVGYQYTTPNADTGEKDTGSKITTGTICSCGNTDHRAHIRLLGDVQRLLDRLVHEEDVELDQREVFDAYLSGKSIDEAVGEAVAKN